MIYTAHRKYGDKAGFTLTELVVVIGMMSVIISTLFLSLSISQQTVSETTRNAEVVGDAVLILSLLKDDLGSCVPPTTDYTKEVKEGDDTPHIDDPGYAFIIRNHSAQEDPFDRLLFSTRLSPGSGGLAIDKNVCYFVYFDDTLKRNVLVRQVLYDMEADFDEIPPIKEEDIPEGEEGEGGEGEEEEEPKKVALYEVLSTSVERFEVQYLDAMKYEDFNFCIPDKFVPEFGQDPVEAVEYNFRDSDIWGDSLHPTRESIPRAIRVILVLSTNRGRHKYYFSRVFRIPKTSPPNSGWSPPEEVETEE